MIILKLTGGLGNQMFEYAFARHLAILNNTDLKFDISDFEIDELRDYSLGCFSLDEKFATKEEIELLANPQGTRKPRKFKKWNWKKFFHKNKGYKKTHIYDGRLYGFEPSLLKKKGDLYVDGYFQTPRYFNAVAETIKKDFVLKAPLDGKNMELAERIKSSNSISVHIRRADYITIKQFYDVFGVCSVDYYNKCSSAIAKKVESPNFFVFSDEIEWAKENLKFDHPVEFISHNNDKPEEDLRLMSLCDHNIVANSTFSWWGAWLNDNKDKIVYAPKKWIANPKKKYDIENLVCKDWIKL